MLLRRLPWTVVSAAAPFPLHSSIGVFTPIPKQLAFSPLSFCSTSDLHLTHHPDKPEHEPDNRRPQHLKPGLYLVGTPIGNLEDITFRALRVLNSADIILSEDTRHSGKLLHHYNIKTPLMSYHKFNESHREQLVLRRLKQGEIVALISDAGTPGISDPGMELAKLCVSENVPVVPIPGPCALVSALSASGLSTDEFTFVGFLPKHSGSRRKRLMASAEQTATQIFYVPPHKLSQFLEEGSSIFGDTRKCVIAREMTKFHEEVVFVFILLKSIIGSLKPDLIALHIVYHLISVVGAVDSTSTIHLNRENKNKELEVFSLKGSYKVTARFVCRDWQFWRGSLGEANHVFSTRLPKGELTILIEGQANSKAEPPSDTELENELRELIENGESLSTAVKLVTGRTSASRKTIYSLALRKFGKQLEVEDDSS
ncbi:hypothetical protein KIW84_050498 [Lathyrus oleraceus]|uniref:Tetrapyrrole methylase domain-containing protein n=1 Tax=Pisum sativum TaxID=3888 RepID=A0A9D5A9F3_PEA|nr:hypothetical protein KIW84_050498 [Pisum sativum]